MPVPQDLISTTTGPVSPNDSKIEQVIKEADAEEAVEEYLPDEN